MTADNGEGAVWDIDPESWARRACAIANRTLTRDGVGRVPPRPALRARVHVARGEELRMHASDGALLGRRLKGAKGLALLGAAVLMGALLVSIDDGSASDGAVSLASAAPSKIALIRSEYRPRWSPPRALRHQCGRERIVEAVGNREIHSPATATQYELGSDPAWSPDGRKIAFVGMGDDGNTDVYVVGADGLGQQRLTRHPGVDGNPAWSPDGRKIAFTRRDREWSPGKDPHLRHERRRQRAAEAGARTRPLLCGLVARRAEDAVRTPEPAPPCVGPVPGDFPRTSTS